MSVDVPLFKEEAGTCAPLVKFTSIDEAIRMANDLPYGLQSAVFTNDINKALDIVTEIRSRWSDHQLVFCSASRPSRSVG
jgi:succinyl-CoA reductase